MFDGERDRDGERDGDKDKVGTPVATCALVAATDSSTMIVHKIAGRFMLLFSILARL